MRAQRVLYSSRISRAFSDISASVTGSVTVTKLPDWSVESFRQYAFKPALPIHLQTSDSSAVPATSRWFKKHGTSKGELAELRFEYWEPFGDAIVPLEVTKVEADSGNYSFQQLYAPLKTLLKSIKLGRSSDNARVYLAQCQLQDLPLRLRQDLPTPDIVLRAGKGDIYDANLWMGLPPTNTPLHRDPNPNLFIQLSGQKVVRLYPPEVGASILSSVQQKLGTYRSSNMRGQEMMQGKERTLLDEAVWNFSQDQKYYSEADSQVATLNPGEALFIPLGWWHSIKGLGDTINASVNFWFR